MKQRLSLFLLLMAMAMGQARADDWKLVIGGTMVTDDNHGNVTGPNIMPLDKAKGYRVACTKDDETKTYIVNLDNVLIQTYRSMDFASGIFVHPGWNVVIQLMSENGNNSEINAYDFDPFFGSVFKTDAINCYGNCVINGLNGSGHLTIDGIIDPGKGTVLELSGRLYFRAREVEETMYEEKETRYEEGLYVKEGIWLKFNDNLRMIAEGVKNQHFMNPGDYLYTNLTSEQMEVPKEIETPILDGIHYGKKLDSTKESIYWNVFPVTIGDKWVTVDNNSDLTAESEFAEDISFKDEGEVYEMSVDCDDEWLTLALSNVIVGSEIKLTKGAENYGLKIVAEGDAPSKILKSMSAYEWGDKMSIEFDQPLVFGGDLTGDYTRTVLLLSGSAGLKVAGYLSGFNFLDMKGVVGTKYSHGLAFESDIYGWAARDDDGNRTTNNSFGVYEDYPIEFCGQTLNSLDFLGDCYTQDGLQLYKADNDYTIYITDNKTINLKEGRFLKYTGSEPANFLITDGSESATPTPLAVTCAKENCIEIPLPSHLTIDSENEITLNSAKNGIEMLYPEGYTHPMRPADAPQFDTENGLTVEGSGTLTITAESNGILCDGYMGFGGSGRTTITAKVCAINGNYGAEGTGLQVMCDEGCQLVLTGTKYGAVSYVRQAETEIATEDVTFEDYDGEGTSICLVGSNHKPVTDAVELRLLKQYAVVGNYVITEHNIADVVPAAVLSSGTVEYDEATSTLTLTDAKVTATGDDCGLQPLCDMTIKVVGENSITSQTVGFRNDVNSVTIADGGNGWLAITAEGAAISNEGDLTVKDVHIEAQGNGGGYLATDATSTLTIDGGMLRLCGGDNDGTIMPSARGYNLTVKNGVEEDPVAPEGYTTWSNPSGRFEARNDVNKVTTQWVKYGVSPAKINYGIAIGSTEVTGQNCDDVQGMGIVGKVSYDERTRTLTLANAQLDEAPIRIPAGKVSTLLLVGDNTMTGAGGTGVAIDAVDLLTITSADDKGTLTISGSSVTTAINAPGGLTVNLCTVDATSTGKGIDLHETGILTVVDATLLAAGTGAGSLVGVQYLEGNAEVVKPADSWFNATGDLVVDVEGTETIVKSQVKVEAFYGVTVGETKVSRSNYTDVKDDKLTAGKVSYDPLTATLTLDNITLNGTGIELMAYDKESTVNLVGTSTIKSNTTGLRGGDKMTVTSADGKGALSITAPTGMAAPGVTISNCTATIDAKETGITTFTGGNVTIDKANVSISVDEDSEWGGAIMYVSGLVLGKGETIETPVGAAYDDESNRVMAGGAVVKKIVFNASQPGDVNADGVVNITDVTMTISHILGQNPEGFNASAADVDSDDRVNITDVTTIIDMILKK
ncbi:MAG: dockerin type I repeat-containing protein [Prevotella sp.]|nr:dockerin type I repeat-containing protein [Prevotella sp.]